MNLTRQLAIILFVISMTICGYIAKKKGRSPAIWGAVGFLIIGPAILLLIAIIMGAVAGLMGK